MDLHNVDDVSDKDIFAIDPDRVMDSDGFYMTMALICNDLSDLVYIHDLLGLKSAEVDTKKKSKYESANFVGRRIYIIRHASSLIYSVLEFMDKRKADFKQIPSNYLGQDELVVLKRLRILSTYLFPDKVTRATSGMSKSSERVLETIGLFRNNLTYHYYNAQKYLKQGFNKRYKQREGAIGSRTYPYVNDSSKIEHARNYYIDSSMETYIKENFGKEITGLHEYSEKYLIELIIGTYGLFKRILKNFYSSRRKDV